MRQFLGTYQHERLTKQGWQRPQHARHVIDFPMMRLGLPIGDRSVPGQGCDLSPGAALLFEKRISQNREQPCLEAGSVLELPH